MRPGRKHCRIASSSGRKIFEMSGTVRAKNVHLLARPCVKAEYAACGCDLAIRVRCSTSSTQVVTFPWMYFSLKASVPIAAPRCLLLSFVLDTPEP